MYTYARYLSSKRTVDDRALNRQVFECVRSQLAERSGPMRVLEVGAGLGTMIARLVDWGLLRDADYYALDEDADLIRSGRSWLAEWGKVKGHSVDLGADGVRIRGTGIDVRAHFVQAEIRQFLERPSLGERALIANAFLDLVELPATLKELFALLKPDGVYWFSINYDSETVFLPEHPEDAKFFEVYDRSMDHAGPRRQICRGFNDRTTSIPTSETSRSEHPGGGSIGLGRARWRFGISGGRSVLPPPHSAHGRRRAEAPRRDLTPRARRVDPGAKRRARSR